MRCSHALTGPHQPLCSWNLFMDSFYSSIMTLGQEAFFSMQRSAPTQCALLLLTQLHAFVIPRSYSAGVVTEKYHRQRGFKARHLFSLSSGGSVSEIKVLQGSFFCILPPWLADGRLPPVSAHHLPPWVCVLISSFLRTQSDWIRAHPNDLI